MFTILSRVVYTKKYGRSVYNRYYQSRERAQHKMDNEAKFYLSNGYWKLERQIDRMNHEKGFYEYEIWLRSTDDKEETMILALLDGHFED